MTFVSLPCPTSRACRGCIAGAGLHGRAALLAVLLPATAVLAEAPDGGPADGPPPPRGGSYVDPGEVADVTREDYVLRATWFDPWFDTVTVEGQPLSGRSLPPGISVWDHEGSAIIAFGEGQAVVLRGVTVAEWRSGAARQLHGSPADDVLEGTGDLDVIAGGGGADDIVPGDGDDRINYGSGNDVVRGGERNRGHDTLDLRRFGPDDVRFAAQGADALIETPTGTIRLEGQLAGAPGNSLANIELVLLREEEVDEAGIRERALARPLEPAAGPVAQVVESYIAGGPENDMLVATDGRDVFVFQPGGGSDLIVEFDPTAGDLLRFVGVPANEVVTVPSGSGLLVSYPGGSIRLEGVAPGDLQEDSFEHLPAVGDHGDAPAAE